VIKSLMIGWMIRALRRDRVAQAMRCPPTVAGGWGGSPASFETSSRCGLCPRCMKSLRAGCPSSWRCLEPLGFAKPREIATPDVCPQAAIGDFLKPLTDWCPRGGLSAHPPSSPAPIGWRACTTIHLIVRRPRRALWICRGAIGDFLKPLTDWCPL
jgi:hypothetical protein